MHKVINSIRDRIFQGDTTEQLIDTITIMMSEGMGSYKEIMDMPLPAFSVLVESLGRVRKKQEGKRGRKHR